MDALSWNKDDSRFPIEGKLQFAQPADTKRPYGGKLSPTSAVLAVQSTQELPVVVANKELIFPQDTAGIRDASLLLLRDKTSKPGLVRVKEKTTTSAQRSECNSIS